MRSRYVNLQAEEGRGRNNKNNSEKLRRNVIEDACQHVAAAPHFGAARRRGASSSDSVELKESLNHRMMDLSVCM